MGHRGHHDEVFACVSILKLFKKNKKRYNKNILKFFEKKKILIFSYERLRHHSTGYPYLKRNI